MPDVPLTPDELLTTTRSVRKRLDLTRPVPLDLVKECLEIALQAPSGGMRQGWHWIVVTDPQVRAQIGDFYRRSAEPYLARAAADPSRGAESEIAELLGLPGDIRQGALIPTAYYTGDTFRPAARRPLAGVLHVDHW